MGTAERIWAMGVLAAEHDMFDLNDEFEMGKASTAFRDPGAHWCVVELVPWGYFARGGEQLRVVSGYTLMSLSKPGASVAGSP